MEVYYEEFNFEKIAERPAYTPSNYISDIGGVLGLWVGFSMLTITEFVELCLDLLILKIRGGKRKSLAKGQEGHTFHMGTNPQDKTDFPAVEETVNDKEEKQDGDRKKKGNRKGRRPLRKQVVPSSDYWSDTSADNRSKMSDSPEALIPRDSGDVKGYTPDDYIHALDTPSQYSASSHGRDSRLTSRDVQVQLGT
ncbi:hypothetical protein CAPTEDRAFT_220280 [Capitella teleta]|uniref:Uncharacterized protein n=1 Tax=Capitella teleta TaxID=283909 RepID=R7UL57_CAPTE|nr:hypothetical protein CAPTEDRAFT_220280 [Capitella teleta]|eukprot:ELU04523.1 hypothetical protein CAPTEDRAFT_220280 [Capitella teleta]